MPEQERLRNKAGPWVLRAPVRVCDDCGDVGAGPLKHARAETFSAPTVCGSPLYLLPNAQRLRERLPNRTGIGNVFML